MMRLFIDSAPNIDGRLMISGEDFDHLRVLRTKLGEIVELCNPEKKMVYKAEIIAISRQDAQVCIISKNRVDSDPSCKITLFQAVPKFDKMEMMIQKCVELGITEIVPVLTARTQTHPANAGVKAKRWQKIAKEAASQSRRDIVPNIANVISLDEALNGMARFDRVFVANENEANVKARAAFKSSDAKNVAIFVGPEGGFEDSEIEMMRSLGIESVTLGKRVLRVETASIAAVILYLCAREEL